MNVVGDNTNNGVKEHLFSLLKAKEYYFGAKDAAKNGGMNLSEIGLSFP